VRVRPTPSNYRPTLCLDFVARPVYTLKFIWETLAYSYAG